MRGLLAPARSKPECSIVTTGAELALEMMSIRKGFPLTDATRGRGDAGDSQPAPGNVEGSRGSMEI